MRGGAGSCLPLRGQPVPVRVDRSGPPWAVGLPWACGQPQILAHRHQTQPSALGDLFRRVTLGLELMDFLKPLFRPWGWRAPGGGHSGRAFHRRDDRHADCLAEDLVKGTVEALQETLERFPEVLQQVPAVGDLERLGRAEGGGFLVRTGTISGNRPLAKVSSLG